MKRLRVLTVLVAALTAVLQAASAQGIQRIVAIVNNDVVSQHDLQNRIDLLFATSNAADTAAARQQLSAEVLQALIADRLKAQEARRLNLTVTQNETERALSDIAAQLRIPPTELKPLIEGRGAKMSTLIDQVEVEIAWSKVVQRVAANQIAVGEDEIDEDLARASQTPSGFEYRVAEIFLPVNNRGDEGSVQALAQRLIDDLRQGAAFPALARTFSQGSTAQSGGDLGWVRRGQLDPELDKYLDELTRGEMIGPLKTSDGFRLLLLIDKRQPMESKMGRTVLTLLQVFAPLPAQAGGAQAAAAGDALRRLARGASSCEEVERRNQAAPSPLPTNTSQVAMRDLPSELVPLVMPLNVGESAGPLQVTNGLLTLVVCDRSEEAATAEMREASRQRLQQQRLTEASQRLLRELRRNALIEVRQ